MTFWKSRYWKNNHDWEILRYANKLWYSIIWWWSKLFKYFLNNYVTEWEKIKTYADLRFSTWEIYKKIWFKLINQSNPNYFYFKEWSLELHSRIQYQKHKLIYKLEIFDENLSESQNMYNNWYRKIYDCWNLVFEYVK